jgi:hypothetical protein
VATRIEADVFVFWAKDIMEMQILVLTILAFKCVILVLQYIKNYVQQS